MAHGNPTPGEVSGHHSPAGKSIILEYYAHRREEIGEFGQCDDLAAIEAAGKKLIGGLADALEEYYRREATSEDRIEIRISRGKGFAYEPQVTFRNSAPSHTLPIAPGLGQDGGAGLTIAPTWDREYLHAIIRRCDSDTEFRLRLRASLAL